MESNQIQHISHPDHPLVLRSSDNNTFKRCEMCRSNCKAGLVYACKKCTGFRIHESCAKLPSQINHPFHPQHPLSLFVIAPYSQGTFECNACETSSWGSTYHCPQCKFDLDINCASLIPRRTIESNYKSSHPHPLFLCNTLENDHTLFYCCGCGLPIEKDSVYACLECHTWFCQTCGVEVPRQLKHPFHPDHTLVLLLLDPKDTRSFRCSICPRKINRLVFHCLECEFNLDIPCSFLRPINTANSNDDVRHPHPLFLCESKKKYDFSCACGKPFKDDSISMFWCLTCSHLLHKSCFDLPLEIKYVLHPNHPLLLRHSYETFDCNACMVKGIGFAYTCYHCENCNFCTRCAFKTPHTINSELHKHPLAFVSQMYSHEDSNLESAKPICTLCDFYCAPNWLRCVPCNINFHFQCIPTLPQKVSYRFHRHAFTLNKSPIKDHEDEDENSEFLCDICEKERRLYDPTYYCAKCHYVAHIHCLIPEIVHLMEEEWCLTHKLGDTNEAAKRALEWPKSQTVEVTEQYSLKEAMKPEELDKLKELKANVRVHREKLHGLKKRLEAFEKSAQLVDL